MIGRITKMANNPMFKDNTILSESVYLDSLKKQTKQNDQLTRRISEHKEKKDEKNKDEA